MTLLKLKCKGTAIPGKDLSEDREDRHVGVVLPQHVHSYLTLYTYANSISKTTVIKNLLEGWMDTAAAPSDRELVDKIVIRSLTVWKRKKAKDAMSAINQFKKQLIAELQWKGLPLDKIKQILTGFNDGTN